MLFVVVAVAMVSIVSADISSPPTAAVACTATGFSPTFSKTFEATKTIGYEVHLGDVTNTPADAGQPCNAKVDEVTANSGLSISATELNGKEIPYKDGSNVVSCHGTLANTDDTTKIVYSTNVDVIVTQSFRTLIKRQYKYQYILKCSLTREADPLTGGQKWTISSTIDPTGETDVQDTAFTFPVAMDFYTDANRGTVKENTFSIKQGEDLFLRVKESPTSALFKFVVKDCWSTPDAASDHGTKDSFFVDQCGVDETVEFLDKTANDAANFDFKMKAFFFSSAPAAEVYFHCQLYVCLQDDTDASKCIQKTNAQCNPGGKRRKRRDIGQDGSLETRTISSKQHVLLPQDEIFVPDCPQNSVYNRQTQRCSSSNIMEVKGVYLNQPWKHEYYNTTSTEFKRMAAEKAYQLFSLLQLHDDGDNILGVKVVSAHRGALILDVQLIYKPTISSNHAFQIFKKAIHEVPPRSTAQRIINILQVQREKIIDYIDVVPLATTGQNTDFDKMILIVLVVVLGAVVFISGAVFLKVRHTRRAPAVVTGSPAQVKNFENPTLEYVS